MSASTSKPDLINIALIAASAIAARLFPHELFAFSFCILGPLHYLTQISWMSDRGNFVAEPRFGSWMWALAIMLGLSELAPSLRQILFPACMGSALACAWICSLAPPQTPPWVKDALCLASLPACAALSLLPPAHLALGTLLPTIVHVLLFTALFMLTGAIKSKKASSAANLGALLGACMWMLIWPAATSMGGANAASEAFSPLARIISAWMPADSSSLTGATAFIAFFYTHHYLNWFAKSQATSWHLIPAKRWAMIGAAYCAMLLPYFFSFELGFALATVGASLHVFLEFPLDLRSLKFALLRK